MEVALHWREGTQDIDALNEVCLENCYGLPERFHKDDVILDVGAHIGSFTMACLARDAQRIYAFEPDAKSRIYLRKNIAACEGQDKVTVVPRAMWRSDVEEKARHWQPPLGTATYMMVPQECPQGIKGATNYRNVERLDEWLRTACNGRSKVRFLKLDCEGSEYPILHTSLRLHRVEEIAGEFHKTAQELYPEWDCSNEAMTALLEVWGFKVEIIPDKNTPDLCQVFRARR